MKTLTLTIAAVATLVWFAQSPDDRRSEYAIAAGMERSERADQAREHFEKAARLACGENAGWTDLGNGKVRCSTKHGRKTVTAEVQR